MKVNEMNLLSKETLDEHKKLVKRNPPPWTYDEFSLEIQNMANEMENLGQLAYEFYEGSFEKAEKDFPTIMNKLKKGNLLPQLEKIAKKEMEKDKLINHLCYCFTRICVPLIIGKIFATGQYKDEDGKQKAVLTFYRLFALCFKVFDDPDFIFGVDIGEEFIFLNVYLKNLDPYTREPDFEKSLIHMEMDDFAQSVVVCIGALKDMKERVEALIKEYGDSKKIYPKIDFIDAAIKALTPMPINYLVPENTTRH